MKRINLFALLFLLSALLIDAQTPLVILHTNDTHSQLEPFEAGNGFNSGKAGILRRENLIRQVMLEESNVLVFDAGDFVQGTPYFNVFKGDAEVKLMNFLHLDAVTLGNHEFDNGVDALADMLKKAEFPVVATNYDVSHTVLKTLVRSWLIIKRGNLLIGIVGANINPRGLIMNANFEGVVYLDPLAVVEARAAWLKQKKKCDVVICLSHLGYQNDRGEPDDLTLAEKSRNIDVIIGGHTHSFLKEPALIQNLEGDTVVANQVGDRGLYVGKIKLLVYPKGH